MVVFFLLRNKEFRRIERDFLGRNSTRALPYFAMDPRGFRKPGRPTRSHWTSQIEFRRSTELSDRPAAHDTRGIADRKMPASPLVAFRYVYEPRKTPTNVHISSSLSFSLSPCLSLSLSSLAHSRPPWRQPLTFQRVTTTRATFVDHVCKIYAKYPVYRKTSTNQNSWPVSDERICNNETLRAVK